MALTFKEIQAKLIAQQANKDRIKAGGGFGGDNAIYPFWNNPDGSTATVRFLPDGDDTNDFFWVERLIIKLPFPSALGQFDNKPVEVQVPCTDMWKSRTCPITAAISPWWNDKSLEDMARKYYRKVSYLYQGFVTSNPNKEDQEPENPIRRFVMNKDIHAMIKKIMLAKDTENSPTDYDNGLDFYLKKTMKKTPKGTFANYDDCDWARRERALSNEEREAIEKYKLFNLSSFLPKKPDEEHLKAIMELFEASVNEEPYDENRWGQFYRPTGWRNDDSKKTSEDAPIVHSVKVVEKAKETSFDENDSIDTLVKEPSTSQAVDTKVASKARSTDDIIRELRNQRKS